MKMNREKRSYFHFNATSLSVSMRSDRHGFSIDIYMHANIIVSIYMYGMLFFKINYIIISNEKYMYLFFVQAGTGKTFLATTIRTHLMATGKRVAVATSTGIVGRQNHFPTTTIHRGLLLNCINTYSIPEIQNY